MRIASVEVIPYALPFREPYVTARGTLTRREMALLRIRDDGRGGRPRRSGPALAARRRDLAQVVGELEALAGLDSLDEAADAATAPASPRRPAARR